MTPRDADRRRRGWLILILALALALAPPASAYVTLEYFHQAGCVNCERTDPIIREIREQYGTRVFVKDILIDNRDAIRLLISYGRTEIPVVVLNHQLVLDGADISRERLAGEIGRFESGVYPANGKGNSDAPSLLAPELLTILFSFVLGILTGISPCLLGSLVVIIAATAGAGGKGVSGRWYPLIFGAGLVTSYLVAAAGILGSGVAFSLDTAYRPTVFAGAGLISIFAGLIQAGLIRLPERAQSGAERLLTRIHTPGGAFILGLVFAFLFAPCAGAPLLILIDTILIGSSVAPYFMVLAYGLGILVPFAIVVIAKNSVPPERFIRYSTLVQRVAGVFLVGFGIWLIVSI